MKSTLRSFEAQEQLDPRARLEPEVLALAKRNAYPVVAQRTAKNDGFGLAAGLAGALLLGSATFWSLSDSRTAEQTDETSSSSAPQDPSQSVLVIPPEAVTDISAGRSAASPSPAARAQPSASMLPPAHNPGTFVQPAPVVVFDGTSATGTPAGSAAMPPDAPGMPSAQPPGGGPLAESSPAVSATRMANPAFTVSQGTLIPAVLETAINSDLPGYARAVVSMDVKSFDGSRVLVPRSSRLIGEYKSGVTGGQSRVYVLWTRLIRPDGVSVALASPAVDAAGQTGLTGEVNSHFMKRFGSALLLSVVGAASALASGGSSLIVAGGHSAASVAAQQNGQIPPTIKVRQGQPIRVFTAKDLDFSTVTKGAS